MTSRLLLVSACLCLPPFATASAGTSHVRPVHITLTVRASTDAAAPPVAMAECVAALDPCEVDIGLDDRNLALRISAHDAARGIRLTVTPLLGGPPLSDAVVAEGRPLMVRIGRAGALWLVPTHVPRD